MERKKIEISALLRAGHKKMDIVKLQIVSLSTVKRVANCLKNNENLEDQPRFGRPQVIQRDNVRIVFLKDLTLTDKLFPSSLFTALDAVATEIFFFFANSVILNVGSFRKAFRTLSR